MRVHRRAEEDAHRTTEVTGRFYLERDSDAIGEYSADYTYPLINQTLLNMVYGSDKRSNRNYWDASFEIQSKDVLLKRAVETAVKFGDFQSTRTNAAMGSVFLSDAPDRKSNMASEFERSSTMMDDRTSESERSRVYEAVLTSSNDDDSQTDYHSEDIYRTSMTSSGLIESMAYEEIEMPDYEFYVEKQREAMAYWKSLQTAERWRADSSSSFGGFVSRTESLMDDVLALDAALAEEETETLRTLSAYVPKYPIESEAPISTGLTMFKKMVDVPIATLKDLTSGFYNLLFSYSPSLDAPSLDAPSLDLEPTERRAEERVAGSEIRRDSRRDAIVTKIVRKLIGMIGSYYAYFGRVLEKIPTDSASEFEETRKDFETLVSAFRAKDPNSIAFDENAMDIIVGMVKTLHVLQKVTSELFDIDANAREEERRNITALIRTILSQLREDESAEQNGKTKESSSREKIYSLSNIKDRLEFVLKKVWALQSIKKRIVEIAGDATEGDDLISKVKRRYLSDESFRTLFGALDSKSDVNTLMTKLKRKYSTVFAEHGDVYAFLKRFSKSSEAIVEWSNSIIKGASSSKPTTDVAVFNKMLSKMDKQQKKLEKTLKAVKKLQKRKENLKEEVKFLKSAEKIRQEKFRTLSAELEQSDKENKSATEKLTRLDSEMGSLKETSKKQSENLKKQEKRFKEMSAEKKKLQTELETSTSAISKLKEEKEALERKQNNLKKTISGLETTDNENKRKIRESKQRLKETTEQLQELNQKYPEQEKTLEKQKEEIEGLSSKMKTLEEQIEKQNEILAERQKELEETKKQMTELERCEESKKTNREQNIETIKILDSIINSLEEEKKFQERVVKSLEEEKKLKNELEESPIESLRQQMESLTLSENKLQIAKKSTEHEMDVKRKISIIEESSKERTELISKQQELERLLREAEDYLENIKKLLKVKTPDEINSKIKEHMASLEDASKKVKELESKLEESESKLNQFEQFSNLMPLVSTMLNDGRLSVEGKSTNLEKIWYNWKTYPFERSKLFYELSNAYFDSYVVSSAEESDKKETLRVIVKNMKAAHENFLNASYPSTTSLNEVEQTFLSNVASSIASSLTTATPTTSSFDFFSFLNAEMKTILLKFKSLFKHPTTTKIKATTVGDHVEMLCKQFFGETRAYDASTMVKCKSPFYVQNAFYLSKYDVDVSNRMKVQCLTFYKEMSYLKVEKLTRFDRSTLFEQHKRANVQTMKELAKWSDEIKIHFFTSLNDRHAARSTSYASDFYARAKDKMIGRLFYLLQTACIMFDQNDAFLRIFENGHSTIKTTTIAEQDNDVAFGAMFLRTMGHFYTMECLKWLDVVIMCMRAVYGLATPDDDDVDYRFTEDVGHMDIVDRLTALVPLKSALRSDSIYDLIAHAFDWGPTTTTTISKDEPGMPNKTTYERFESSLNFEKRNKKVFQNTVRVKVKRDVYDSLSAVKTILLFRFYENFQFDASPVVGSGVDVTTTTLNLDPVLCVNYASCMSKMAHDANIYNDVVTFDGTAILKEIDENIDSRMEILYGNTVSLLNRALLYVDARKKGALSIFEDGVWKRMTDSLWSLSVQKRLPTRHASTDIIVLNEIQTVFASEYALERLFLKGAHVLYKKTSSVDAEIRAVSNYAMNLFKTKDHHATWLLSLLNEDVESIFAIRIETEETDNSSPTKKMVISNDEVKNANEMVSCFAKLKYCLVELFYSNLFSDLFSPTNLEKVVISKTNVQDASKTTSELDDEMLYSLLGPIEKFEDNVYKPFYCSQYYLYGIRRMIKDVLPQYSKNLTDSNVDLPFSFDSYDVLDACKTYACVILDVLSASVYTRESYSNTYCIFSKDDTDSAETKIAFVKTQLESDDAFEDIDKAMMRLSERYESNAKGLDKKMVSEDIESIFKVLDTISVKVRLCCMTNFFKNKNIFEEEHVLKYETYVERLKALFEHTLNLVDIVSKYCKTMMPWISGIFKKYTPHRNAISAEFVKFSMFFNACYVSQCALKPKISKLSSSAASRTGGNAVYELLKTPILKHLTINDLMLALDASLNNDSLDWYSSKQTGCGGIFVSSIFFDAYKSKINGWGDAIDVFMTNVVFGTMGRFSSVVDVSLYTELSADIDTVIRISERFYRELKRYAIDSGDAKEDDVLQISDFTTYPELFYSSNTTAKRPTRFAVRDSSISTEDEYGNEDDYYSTSYDDDDVVRHYDDDDDDIGSKLDSYNYGW
jgi:hypothetical protein